ncbi:MAG: hypothetical protein Q8O55_12955 [Dehalococcoidales bacterium]|nr:hypothetical protein [Dehalococcoidales bacterium]
MNSTEGPRSLEPDGSKYGEKGQRRKALKILARMIVQAYLNDAERSRLAESGERPRLYVENIQVVFTGVDINNTSQRQRLHSMLNEAIERAVSAGLSENSPPLILKRNGIRIKLKC